MAGRAPNPYPSDIEAHPANETTPLLLAPASEEISNKQNGLIASDRDDTKPTQPSPDGEGEADAEKPMPYVQIILLCYTALAEPVAFFSIFPYINEMIHLTGNVDEHDVGFWSGLIESLFSLVQMFLMIFYGRAADRLGRKPVLVFSLVGIAIATSLFGLSLSLWQMILFRCLAGVFAGSVVTVRTMLGENTTKETQGRAFSWYMFVKNMGILIGPVIGGGLANPADRFALFHGVAFWEKYPYALASFAAGVVVISSALISFFFIEETLKRSEPGQSNTDPPMTTVQVLKAPGVPIVLYVFGHTMLLALMYTAISPVYMYTSVHLGGFGFSDQEIALWLAIVGVGQAGWALIAFPTLQKRMGTGTVMRWCSGIWPFFMASYPVLNDFLRRGWVTAFWVVAPIGVLVGSSVSMAFACCQLFINDSSPSPTVLATLNSLALTVNSGIRAFAPVLGTSIYAMGVKSGFARGQLAWFFIVTLAVGLNVPLFYLPEAVEGRPSKTKPSELADPTQDAES